jgi:hypothetical protein
MTVKELIDQLRKLPQDLPVYVKNNCADDGITYHETSPSVCDLNKDQYGHPVYDAFSDPNTIKIVEL